METGSLGGKSGSNDMTNLTPTLALACCLSIEARGTGEAGIRDIASVVWYRAEGKPENVYDVVCNNSWAVGMPEALRREVDKIADYKENIFDWRAWLICMRVATEVMNGDFKQTIIAQQFHSDDGKHRPWMKDRKILAIRNGFVFYAEGK